MTRLFPRGPQPDKYGHVFLANACSKHSRPQRDPDAHASTQSLALLFLPRSNHRHTAPGQFVHLHKAIRDQSREFRATCKSDSNSYGSPAAWSASAPESRCSWDETRCGASARHELRESKEIVRPDLHQGFPKEFSPHAAPAAPR